MPDDEEQQREQEEQMAREQREREEREQREREDAERYQREQDQRNLEQEQREQEERSRENAGKEAESQKEENSKHGPVFDEEKAISRQNELNKLYREVPLTQRFLSHFLPDNWTHAGRMRRAVQMGQRMLDRGINGNDLGTHSNDPKLTNKEKVIADYKENHAKFSKEYNELSGAQRLFSRILPRSWTKAGKLRTDMEMNDKFLREKVVLEKYEIRSLKKEANENVKNSEAAPLASEAQAKGETVKEAAESNKEGKEVEKEVADKNAPETAKDLEEKTTEGNQKDNEKTADLQERLKEDTASELNSSQERYQEEMAMQNTKEMENQQEKEMATGGK